MENLSLVCGGLGIIEEDDDGNQIGYAPGEYCLGTFSHCSHSMNSSFTFISSCAYKMIFLVDNLSGNVADNLKDLLRFLRRDDPETREVFKQVCKWNTVGKDILPIIQYCQSDTTLVLNAGNYLSNC